MIARARIDGDGGFVVVAGGWAFKGELTFANAAAVSEAAQRLPLPAAGTVDLAGLGAADSSALAVMLALKRRAAREGTRISFASVPAGIHRLARVYGVLDLLEVDDVETVRQLSAIRFARPADS